MLFPDLEGWEIEVAGRRGMGTKRLIQEVRKREFISCTIVLNAYFVNRCFLSCLSTPQSLRDSSPVPGEQPDGATLRLPADPVSRDTACCVRKRLKDTSVGSGHSTLCPYNTIRCSPGTGELPGGVRGGLYSLFTIQFSSFTFFLYICRQYFIGISY